MVGRYGGEEFLVVLNKCDPASAVARAENLRQSIFSRRIHPPSSQLTVSISLGLALSTDFPKCDVEELFHHADMALYAAKAAGRNCVRIAQPESVDSKSDLPDVVPDPGIITARALFAAATAVATRDFYFFSRICSIICRIIELEPGARFSLHDSSRAQAFSIAENK